MGKFEAELGYRAFSPCFEHLTENRLVHHPNPNNIHDMIIYIYIIVVLINPSSPPTLHLVNDKFIYNE